MLTKEKIEQNEITYMSLLNRLNVDLTEFNKYLDRVDFFKKPMGPIGCHNYPGGLCEHALLVAHELGVQSSHYYPNVYSEQDILTIALLKDVYRAELYTPYSRNVKNEETGNWEQVLDYKVVDENERQLFGSISISSYMIVKDFFPLTNEQIMAIIHSRDSEHSIEYTALIKRYPLLKLTKIAELIVQSME